MYNNKIKLITLHELVERIGISKSTIYRRIDPQEKIYDPSFPRPIKIGQNTTRWIEEEVEAWLIRTITKQRTS